MKRLLCISLPDWPIQRLRGARTGGEVETRRNSGEHDAAIAKPPPPSSPIVLWQQDPRHGRLVIARDEIAGRLGIRVGMSIAEATDMALRYPVATRIEMHEPRADRETLETLAARLLEQISPLVAIESLEKFKWAGRPLHQPQAILCDVTGIAHLFEGETGLLRAAAELIAQLGYDARMAIADSVGAAWAVAHYGPQRMVVQVGQAREAISPLPVEALRISPETVATLSRLGIQTIGALLELPRSGLATRLGTRLVERMAEALAESDEPLAVFRPPAEYSSHHELEYPSDDRRILEDRIERLVENVKAGLAARGRGALRLTCCLDLTAHPTLTLEIGLFAPTQEVSHLAKLVVGALENRALPSLVTRLTLDVTLSSPLRSTQTSLFGDMGDDWTNHQSTARLIDSLSGRLGRDAVLGVASHPDPLPEKAFRSFPITGNSTQTQRSRVRRVSDPEYPARGHEKRKFRPFSLLAAPVALQVDEIPTNNGNEPPSGFRHAGRLHRTLRFWGPERIETGWWYGPCVRRDYFRVETAAGWWWIFRDLTWQAGRPGPWMLHGKG